MTAPAKQAPHDCETWMLQESAQGGQYCAACGKPQNRPLPAPQPQTDPIPPYLGQRVAYSTHVTRGMDVKKHAERAGTVYRRSTMPKCWSTEAWPGKDHDGGEGIIVGKRTLSDGLVVYGNGYDEGTTYEPERHFTAWLVAFDLRRKPVYVLPEHLTALVQP